MNVHEQEEYVQWSWHLINTSVATHIFACIWCNVLFSQIKTYFNFLGYSFFPKKFFFWGHSFCTEIFSRDISVASTKPETIFFRTDIQLRVIIVSKWIKARILQHRFLYIVVLKKRPRVILNNYRLSAEMRITSAAKRITDTASSNKLCAFNMLDLNWLKKYKSHCFLIEQKRSRYFHSKFGLGRDLRVQLQRYICINWRDKWGVQHDWCQIKC